MWKTDVIETTAEFFFNPLLDGWGSMRGMVVEEEGVVPVTTENWIDVSLQLF